MGISTPPEVKTEIEDIEQEIEQLWLEFSERRSESQRCLLTYRVDTPEPGVPLGIGYIDQYGSTILDKAVSPWEISLETNVKQFASLTAYRSDDGGPLTGLIAIDGRPARQVQSVNVVSCSVRLLDIYYDPSFSQNTSLTSGGSSPTM